MPHAVDLHVGRRVRQRRWMLGITQQLLAEQLNITFQQVQKYEKGTNRISSSRLWEIAEILEAPVSYFFEGLKGQATESNDVRGDVLSDKKAIALVSAYYAMPEMQREKLYELACAFGGAPELSESHVA